jgi:hypothetical protein
MADQSDLVERLEALEAEVAELRAAGLPAAVGDEDAGGGEVPQAVVGGRRSVLKMAGAAAAGVVAGLAAARPAAASDGNNLVAGFDNFAQFTTKIINGTGPAAANNDTSAAFDVSGFEQGIIARATNFGVLGEALGAGVGTGVIAVGDRFGVSAMGNSAAIVLQGFGASPLSLVGGHLAGEIYKDGDGNVWVCVASGAPGSWRKVAGPASAGVFHPVTPGRVYDSRVPAPQPGVLAGGANRTVSVADRRNLTTGAVVAADFVPAGATAVAANVTVVSQSAGGFVAVNPGGITTVTASIVNWSANGQAIANAAPLAINPVTRAVTVVASASTHFLIDVLGYWL